ncbi:MAG: hypothetical protein ACRETN_07115 [Nevskiales bacterium]
MKAFRYHFAGIAMTQLSIRNLDSATAAQLKRAAKKTGQSLNRYLLGVLSQGGVQQAGAGQGPHDDLDALAGGWNKAQAQAFERATAPFRKVDETLWR